jgi:hypothetical protein
MPGFIKIAASIWPLVLLAACSSSRPAETSKAPEKPPEPVTGRHAFQNMYLSARAWATDAQPLQLRSIVLQELKSEQGKAGAWQAAFVSVQSARSRSYSFSVVEAAGNLHQGVFAGPVESWSGPGGQSQPFLMAAIKIDSDEAYSIAAKHSADYVRAHPDRPVSFVLEQTKRFPDPAWRVIWGDSVNTSDYSVFVDASTGSYLAIQH